MPVQPAKAKSDRRVLFAATPEFPIAGQKVVVRNYDVNFGTGAIRVRAQRDNATTRRLIAIIRDETMPIYNEPMPLKLPALSTQAGYTELVQEGGTEFFSSDNVPVLGLPAISPVANNKRVFIGSYDVNNDRLSLPDSFPFMAFPSVFPVVVDARCCLWLSFADNVAVLPNGEQHPEYRPIALLVPDKDAMNVGITKVDLAARLMDRWQKGPDPLLITDADGLAGSEADLADPNYKTGGNVHSANITGGAFRKGELVALWDNGTQIATEVEVGFTHPLQVIPTNAARPTKLHLAFHDGVEWSNNTGSVVVQVSWQTG